jgi:hypothetical protein
MRGIERHQRREAVAPVRDIIQRPGIGRLVGIEHPQLRTDGAGIGERQPYFKTETRGRIVHGKDLQGVVLLGDDDAGIIGILFSQSGVAAAKLALDAVDGQARQPQAEDTPPVC